MRLTSSARAVALLLLMSLGLATHALPPPLPVETLSVERLPEASPHWIWVFDEALYNGTDSRLFLYDGDHHRNLGQIDSGYYGLFALSPDHHTMAVSTNYWSRGWHGERVDVVEFTDTRTLDFTGEVLLPPKRAQGPPVTFGLSYSADQRFLYSTNLSPAASISVIDVAARKVLADIDTDGCVMAIPSLSRRVSAICETGKLLSVTLDDQGREVSRGFSEKFFDIDSDPVFVQSMKTADGALFLSFLGDVHEVDLSGSAVAFKPVWSAVAGSERGQWRPGGAQQAGLQIAQGRLYLVMHKGGPGSHKVAGTEVWALDMKTHRRLARFKIDVRKYGGAVAVQPTQDAHPLLFVTTENSSLLTLDPETGRVLYAEAKLGQSPWYLINP
jgi:methylamine dehydrogenase heavy chain